MSSILRALKKMNEEKVDRTNRVRSDTGVLLTGSSEQSNPFVMIASSLLMLALGSGGTYLYVKGEKPVPEVAARKPPLVVTPAKPFPLITTAISLDTVLLPPLDISAPVASGDRPLPLTPLNPRLPRLPLPPVAVAVPFAPPAVSGKEEPLKNQPLLKVDGIAFEGNSEPIAVVNGTPVSSGSVIQGVKIERILVDSVIFNQNGGRVEVKMGETNR